jgi:hypothetical protein
MGALQDWVGCELQWSVSKTPRRHLDLRDGDELVATFRPSYWHFGSKPAAGTCLDEAWSLERHGLLKPTFTYRSVDGDGIAAEIRFRHVRRRTYQDSMGRQYLLRPSSGDKVFTCAERGKPPLIRLHRERKWGPSSWNMTIGPAARATPSIAALAMLATWLHCWRLFNEGWF